MAVPTVWLEWFQQVFGIRRGKRRSRPASARPRPRPRFRPQVEVLEDRIAPATLTVTSLTDDTLANLAGDSLLSLREAIEIANNPGMTIDGVVSNDDADTIQFAPGLLGTITLNAAAGELRITSNLTIAGPGASLLIISGGGSNRIFNVDDANSGTALNVTIGGLTISNGAAGGNYGGGIYNAENLTVKDSTLSGNEAGIGGGIFNAGTLTINNSTLSGNRATFGGGGIFNYYGTLTINNSTLSGNDADEDGGGILNAAYLTINNSTLSGNDAFEDGGGIFNYGTLTINNSTVSGNQAFLGGGGIFNAGTLTINNSTLSDNNADEDGGGIFNYGTLTINNSTLSGNDADEDGGGIFNYGTLTINNSTLSGNDADEDGGGIFNYGTLTINNSTLSDNDADEDGGGIFNRGSLTINNSTLSDNDADEDGGGIFNRGSLTINNSTLSGNRATFGGGIYNYGTLTIRNSTITLNTASFRGGGLYNADSAVSALLHNTIVAANIGLSGDNDIAAFTGTSEIDPSSTNNLIGDASSSGGLTDGVLGNIVGVNGAGIIDPMLAPLGFYGGPTKTHALLPGSPAIDAGNNNEIPPLPVDSFDQRGTPYVRIDNLIVDIGAVESQCSFIVTNTNGSGPGSLAEAIECANETPGNQTITFALNAADPNYNAATGVFTIRFQATDPPLPTVDDQFGFFGVFIDGFSQPDINGIDSIIELDGTGLTGFAHGLVLATGANTISGLVINGFQGNGILIDPSLGSPGFGTANNLITGNIIGLKPDGTTPAGNGLAGIAVFNSNNNTIGGVSQLASSRLSGAGNVISSNQYEGVNISGGEGNLVQGNIIGLDAFGATPLGNRRNGVIITGYSGDQGSLYSFNNTIGGAAPVSVSAPFTGNVISGNSGNGVLIEGDPIISDSFAFNNLVQGNFIGTDITGTARLGNRENGVEINNSAGNTVGGSSAFSTVSGLSGAGNVIAANGNDGVLITGPNAVNNLVQGNFIGINVGNVTATQMYNVDIASTIGNPTAFVGFTGGTGGLTATQQILNFTFNGTPADFSTWALNGSINDIPGTFLPSVIGTTLQLTDGGGSEAGTAFDPNPVDVSNPFTASFQFQLINPGADGITFVLHNDPAGDNALGISGGQLGYAGIINSVAVKFDIFPNGGDPSDNATGLFTGGVDPFGGINLNGTGIDLHSGGVFTVNLVYNGAVLSVTISGGIGGLGNGNNGVEINEASGNTVGGDRSAGFGNLISENDSAGVLITGSGARGNLVQGNFIGTDVTGTNDRGNSSAGVQLFNAPGNTIGGTTAGLRNLISGNDAAGVDITGSLASGNLVQGNFIGTDITGTAVLGNGSGIVIDNAPNNTIGGASSLVNSRISGAGNLIAGNSYSGISITGNFSPGNGTLVQGNFIGTDVSGTDDEDGDGNSFGNGFVGVSVFNTTNNTIGGSLAFDGAGNLNGTGNLVSNNRYSGVGLYLSSFNDIRGNLIGTNVSGTAPLGNGFDGISIFDSSFNTIGGVSQLASSRLSGAGNVISSNQYEGVYISGGEGNLVQGNIIGLDAFGTTPLGNRRNGVIITGYSGDQGSLDSFNNTIGGAAPVSVSAPFTGNVISGNSGNGVLIEGDPFISDSFAFNNLVQGNFIGTDITGTARLGNRENGVAIENSADSNTVTGNLISGNDQHGVFINELFGGGGQNNLISGNTIGPAANGTPLGNSLTGVTINGNETGNTISGNTIAFNGQAGVAVTGNNSIGFPIGNPILGNSIFSNGDLGIDLGGDGVTPNNSGLGGPNNFQNYPELTSATSNGVTIAVQGQLQGNAEATYRIEFFVSAEPDPSGFGEGKVFLGASNVTADPTGLAVFAIILPAMSGMPILTSTATLLGDSQPIETSEFSRFVEIINVVIVVTGGPPVLTVRSVERTPQAQGPGVPPLFIPDAEIELFNNITNLIEREENIALIDEAFRDQPLAAEIGEIRGRVYDDFNAVGKPMPDGVPLEGQRVFIDMNGNGIWDAGEPWTLTNSRGEYFFTGLAAGQYVVLPMLEGNADQTFSTRPENRVELASGAMIADGVDLGVRYRGRRRRRPSGGGQLPFELPHRQAMAALDAVFALLDRATPVAAAPPTPAEPAEPSLPAAPQPAPLEAPAPLEPPAAHSWWQWLLTGTLLAPWQYLRERVRTVVKRKRLPDE